LLKSSPTPGTANTGNATLSSVGNLRFNEWQTNPSSGDDWIEIHNIGPNPVSIGHIYLSDDPSIAGRTKTQITPNSYIAGGGWVKLIADGNESSGLDHLGFELSAGGEHLRMFWSNLSPLDSVDFGEQSIDTAAGRFPETARGCS
jgi:hypothetical protein